MEMGEVSSCFCLVKLWNALSCTPECLMAYCFPKVIVTNLRTHSLLFWPRSWLVQLAKKQPKSVQPFHLDMAMWCLTPPCCQALSGVLIFGETTSFTFIFCPPTAEWGKVWGKQWQEPRWGILDTLDWCMFFCTSGKHSTTPLSISWVFQPPKMLGVQRFQKVVWEVGLEKHKGTGAWMVQGCLIPLLSISSQLFLVFLWCMDITLVTVQLRLSINTLPEPCESAAGQVDFWTSWHSWRWLLAPPHLKLSCGLDLPQLILRPGGCPSVW